MPNRAIFLDRDGVITMRRNDHVKNARELEIVDGVIEAIGLLAKVDWKLVVVTNQSAIGRGLTTRREMSRIHAEMVRRLSPSGRKVDAIYYCPHAPGDGCDCRKPKTGMLLRAARELDIDLSRSWLIGDRATDVKAGLRAGCRVVKVPTNRPDGLLKAVLRILEAEKRVRRKANNNWNEV